MKEEIARLNRLVGDFLTVGRPLQLHPSLLPPRRHRAPGLVARRAQGEGPGSSGRAQPSGWLAPARRRPRAPQDLSSQPHHQQPGRDARWRATRNRRAAPRWTRIPRAPRRRQRKRHDAGRARQSVRALFFDEEHRCRSRTLAHPPILTEHGGTIEVSSTPGSGTHITVTLPAASAESAPERAEEVVAP